MLASYRTWLSRKLAFKCQKIAKIFFLLKKVKFLAFLTFKCQFSGGSGVDLVNLYKLTLSSTLYTAIMAGWRHIEPTVSHIKGNINIDLMHSGIVNRYHLLCYAHTVPERHKGTSALFVFYSLSSFSAFTFWCFCHSGSSIFFLGCLYSLCQQSKDGSRFSLVIPNTPLAPK